MDFQEDFFRPTPTSSDTADKHRLKLDLLNNGIDFVRSGVEHFFNDSDRRALKYAILHLFAGLLLLFKERLSQEHPSLIFKNPQDALKEESKTVDFDEALDRLKVCANVRFDDAQLRLLRRAQRHRNQLEHYEFNLDLREAQSLTGKLSEFIYLFLRDHLNTRLEEHLNPMDWHRLQDLRDIAKRIDQERTEEWRGRAEKYFNLTPEEREELAGGIQPYHPRHNPDPELFHRCDQCGNETLVVTEERDIAVCTGPDCGNVEYVGECVRCDGSVFGTDGFCDDCLAYIEADHT